MVSNICNTSSSCDTAPNLLAQGARILVQGPSKGRVIQIENLFLGVKKTSLEPGGIVASIVIPPLTKNERAACIKHAVRKAMGLAIIGVVVKIKVEDGVRTDARIALSVVVVAPIQAPGAEEALIGKELTDEVTVKASGEAMSPCHPISDIRASAEYGKDMIRVSTERAIRQAMECYNQEENRNET